MSQYFDGIKKGDRIWTIQEGWTEVRGVNDDALFPIGTNKHWYTYDGKFNISDEAQSAFWDYPKIFAPERPRQRTLDEEFDDKYNELYRKSPSDLSTAREMLRWVLHKAIEEARKK